MDLALITYNAIKPKKKKKKKKKKTNQPTNQPGFFQENYFRLFGWFLWHINLCSLISSSFIYIYIYIPPKRMFRLWH